MTPKPQQAQLHASCVSIGSKGILMLGESGSGKSDLALRLIDGGATLVADDRVDVRMQGNALIASAPEKLQGMIEARGVGILTLQHTPEAPLALAVKLVERKDMERMPDPQFFDCLGHKLPLLSLHAFDASAPAKIRLYLQGK